MKKHDKSKRDIISEKVFNARGQSTHLSPQDDSPGDSGDATEEEFVMGLNYMPDEKYEYDDDDMSDELNQTDVNLEKLKEKNQKDKRNSRESR